MIYVQEQNEVISITNRKSIVIWKFNPSAPSTTLQVGEDEVETVTYSKKNG
jgi:hypothetical protein